MARSTKKGPFIDAHVMTRIDDMNKRNEKKVLRTWSRRSTVHPDMVGHTIAVHKLVRSALQNATHVSDEKGTDVDVDRLFVKNAISNEGPRMKRIRPAPMGRAFRYQRRMTHISVVLAEKNGDAKAAIATTVGEEPKAGKATKGKTAGKPAKKKSVAKK